MSQCGMKALRSSSGGICCGVARTDSVGIPLQRPVPMFGRSGSVVARRGLLRLAGGTFAMGGDNHEGFSADGEGPVRDVRVDAFLIDATAVTGEQFSEFVKSTGYVTEAEHFGWSFVFHLFVKDLKDSTTLERPDDTPWWLAVPGACWREPEGPGSNLRDRLDHPVVHVSWADALAYCRWVGMRLPSEAEWEYAARGGLDRKRYPWGDNLRPNKVHHCNIWQGAFPTHNRGDDGHLGTAPVNSYQPNGFGLYNVAGNVWEWCEDWFSPTFHVKGPRVNPKGPPGGRVKVIRGGSYLCHKSYCNRYRVGARTANTPDSSTANSGFRCARDV